MIATTSHHSIGFATQSAVDCVVCRSRQHGSSKEPLCYSGRGMKFTPEQASRLNPTEQWSYQRPHTVDDSNASKTTLVRLRTYSAFPHLAYKLDRRILRSAGRKTELVQETNRPGTTPAPMKYRAGAALSTPPTSVSRTAAAWQQPSERITHTSQGFRQRGPQLTSAPAGDAAIRSRTGDVRAWGWGGEDRDQTFVTSIPPGDGVTACCDDVSLNPSATTAESTQRAAKAELIKRNDKNTVLPFRAVRELRSVGGTRVPINTFARSFPRHSPDQTLFVSGVSGGKDFRKPFLNRGLGMQLCEAQEIEVAPCTWRVEKPQSKPPIWTT